MDIYSHSQRYRALINVCVCVYENICICVQISAHVRICTHVYANVFVSVYAHTHEGGEYMPALFLGLRFFQARAGENGPKPVRFG